MEAARVRLGRTRLGIDNAFARMPFRFGVVTMEAAASLALELEVEVDGMMHKGHSSDLLAYKWFDKRPEKTPADNVADLLRIVEIAAAIAQEFGEGTPFQLWRKLDGAVDRAAVDAGHNRLMASFGTSMIERAMLDAVGKARGLNLHRLLLENSLGFSPREVFPELAGMSLADVLPARPLQKVNLRHTVGLVDPLTAQDAFERVGDGLPETLEDYLRQDGIRYLKIKVGGDLAADLARLEVIAGLLASGGHAVKVTLDGNEQYRQIGDFAALMEAVRSRPALEGFYQSILFVEQPLDRSVALAEPLDPAALERIGRPLLIDEADGHTGAFREAIALGYRGVSHKNCKGVMRSVLNAMLAGLHGQKSDQPGSYFLSAEDLTCLPVVSLQGDLVTVATLGIEHVERNGHHYFRGLDHLPVQEAEAALALHPDLYERSGQRIQLAIRDGNLSLDSIVRQPGLAATVEPDLERRIAPSDWSFDMLKGGDVNWKGGTSE